MKKASQQFVAELLLDLGNAVFLSLRLPK